MSTKIVVPSVGESITEGIIANWIKKDGEVVQNGESLFELETDKITTEVPAQGSGVVRITVPAGTTVAIGAEVGMIETGSTTAATPVPAVATPAPKPAASPVKAQPVVTQVVTQTPKTDISRGTSIDAAPSVRRKIMAGEQTAAPTTATKPVPAAKAPAPVKFTFQPGEREVRRRMSLLRQKIAQRLVASQQETATLTTFNEADMSAIIDLRERYKDAFKEKFGVGLGFMGFFVKAAIAALKTVPEVNARLDGTDLVYQNFYDIGVAVSTEKGLVVPVLRNADQLNLAQIEKGIADLALRAREGRLTVDELQGGTFTISNGGIYGSLMSTPILNPPQSGILGMHAIKKRPMVVNDQIAIRPMMYLALSYDHRVIDGKESVTFLVNVKEYIETPGKFLLDLL